MNSLYTPPSLPTLTTGATGVLADNEIDFYRRSGKLVIDPYEPAHLQPASYDLTLGDTLLLYDSIEPDAEPTTIDLTRLVCAFCGECGNTIGHTVAPFSLQPGEFALASVRERIALPSDLAAEVRGKSSLGRKGLVIHQTAGWVDPGWDGILTLELSTHRPIELRAGMKIGQITFISLSSPARRPYGHPELGSRYQHATTVEAAKE